MSLIHWWPLNGDTKDYGIYSSNGSLIGAATVTAAGKIGKCLTAGTGAQIDAGVNVANNLISELTGKDYSFAAWVKPNGNHVHYEGAIISSGNWNNKCWAFGLNQSNTAINPAGNWYNTHYINYTFTVGQWYHIASIQKNGTNYVYVNGSLVGSIAHDPISQTDADNLCIGRETYAGGYFSFNGNINDVRIYDHALSAKEVKEISKGLVLHYNFEDEYIEPTTNLSSYSNIGGWNNSGTASYSQNDTNINNVPCPDCKVLSITQTTAGQSAGTFGSTSSNVPSKTLTASVWFYMSGTHTSSNNVGPYIRSNKTDGNIGTLEYNGSTAFRNWPNNQWIKLTKTFTTNSEATTVYFCCYTANADEKFAFNGWQIEEKDHATPWTKNGSPRSNEKVYDSSGYGNNGTVTGNLQISSDSMSGQYSASFIANNTWVATNYSTANLNVLTYSAWVYQTARTSDRSCIAIGGTYFTIDESGHLSGYAYGKSPAGYHTGSSVIPLNQWTHIAIVWDTSYIYGYINGAQDFKIASTGTFNNSKTQDIGRESTTGRQFYGKIGDIKIFATALSEADIKAEYNRKAAIDKNGNLFTGEIVESNLINIIDTARWGIAVKSWNNCLGRSGQANNTQTFTNSGLRIYRTPNHDGLAQSGHGWDNWGGIKFTPILEDSNALQKGHTYLIKYHVVGKTCDTLNQGWDNQMGWGGGGLSPSPSNVTKSGVSGGFNGEKDCWYKFTINDDVYKTCTSSYSSFVQGTVYPSYRDFVIYCNYSVTNEDGTDLYITNPRMYDITGMTEQEIQILKTGILLCEDIYECPDINVRFEKSKTVSVVSVEEL